jgi:hypothetical protein
MIDCLNTNRDHAYGLPLQFKDRLMPIILS